MSKQKFLSSYLRTSRSRTENVEIAEHAQLKSFIYRCRLLTVLQKALAPAAPSLHSDGNILHCNQYKNGDVEKGFLQSAFVVEETYELPRQMHAYMETEGGVIVPESDEKITVYTGTQHGSKDRFQLARILAIPEEDIPVVSNPIGGSFGGKDDLNIQPYGALLAMVTNCPVKIHQSRQESVRACLKTIHGGGLGVGRLDPAGGSLALSSDGKLEAAFGFEE